MKVHCTIHIRNKISITGYARAGNETVLSRKQTRRDRLDLVSSRDFRLVTGSRIRIALTWNTPGLLNLAALCSPLCPRSSTTFASAPPSRRAFTTAPSPPRWEATSRGVVKPDPNWTRSRKKVLKNYYLSQRTVLVVVNTGVLNGSSNLPFASRSTPEAILNHKIVGRSVLCLFLYWCFLTSLLTILSLSPSAA